MSNVRSYTTDAIVLRNRPLGEKDRIVSLLSREHGKIPTVAKGARRPGSRLAAPTQPFAFAQFALARGRNFDLVTQVVIHDTFHALHTNLLATACALCATELLDRALSERHPEPALFDLLRVALPTLAAGDNCEVTLRAFQLRAASVLGYQPQLNACVRCGSAEVSHQPPLPTHLFFSFHFGGVLCPGCRSFDLGAARFGAGTMELLRALMSGTDPQLARLRVADYQRGELTRIVDGWIERRLEVRLKAKAFLGEVLRTE